MKKKVLLIIFLCLINIIPCYANSVIKELLLQQNNNSKTVMTSRIQSIDELRKSTIQLKNKLKVNKKVSYNKFTELIDAWQYFVQDEKYASEASLTIGNLYYFANIQRYKALSWWKKAAKYNNPEAIYTLALLYYYGDIVEQNYKQAYNLLIQLKKLDTINDMALYYLGLIYLEHTKPKKTYLAKKSFTKAANLGNAAAIYQLAKLQYADKKMDEAFKLYKQAAYMDNTQAQYALAMMYYNGETVTKNNKKAVEWLKESAYAPEVACLDAKKQLAMMYMYGFGVAKNLQKAQLILDDILATDNDADGSSELSLAKDYYLKNKLLEAKYWANLAIELGNTHAYSLLGMIYYSNELNIPEAIKYFTQGVENNDADAMYNLGMIYFKGYTKDPAVQNYQKAYVLFEQATKLQHPKAEYLLGIMLQDGKGVTKNINKAQQLFELSARHGYDKAVAQLGDIHLKKLNKAKKTDTDKVEQLKSIFKDACDNGSTKGCELLNKLIEP